MLNIEKYSEQITEFYNQGKTAFEIYKILGLKYCQPIYNYFKKMNWDRTKREDYNMNRKYNIDDLFFEKIDTEEKSYILGFICADGHIDENRIKIQLKDDDYKLLEMIKTVIGSNTNIKRKIKRLNPYKNSNNKILYQCSIEFNSKKLVKPLKNMGLCGKKTYSLNSSIMKYIPSNLIRHFLRGFFDGDGSVVWEKHYSSGNKYLIQVAGNEDFLINSFQKYFPSNCKLYKYKKTKQCFAWKIADKRKVLEFLNYIYSDAKIYLDRKYKIYKYAMWSFKTELIAGNSYFSKLLEGQSAANPLIKCLGQVQRLANETIKNPFEEEIEYNFATNAQRQELQKNLDEDIVRTVQ